MKLFLTSTGITQNNREFFLSKLPDIPQNLVVAFIPTAADPDSDKWYVDAALNQLKDLGFKIIIVDLKDDPIQVKKALESSDCIFINGGNTFYLMDWIRKSGVPDYLKDLLNQGKIYIGGSAGAVVAGPDIAAAGWSPNWDSNIVNLNDTSGLNVVPFVTLPHFIPDSQSILDTHLNYPFEVIPISDTQAIYFENGEYQIIG